MTKRLIIGLTGNPGSGKSTIARYLADKHGFHYFEGSDYLRDQAKQRGVELKTRGDYSDLHRALQKEYGASVIADYLLARPEKRLTFAGLRSTQNARKLQSAGGVVIALEAPADVRFARIDHHGLKSQTKLADFEAAEAAQLVSKDHLGADLLSTMKVADVTLNTSKPLADVLTEIDCQPHPFPTLSLNPWLPDRIA